MQQTSLIASHYVAPLLTENALGKVHSVFKNGLNVKAGNRLAFLGKGSHPISGIGLNFDNERLLDEIISQVKPGTIVKFKDDQAVFYTRPRFTAVHFDQVKDTNLSLPVGLQMLEPQYDYLIEAFQDLNPYASSGFNDGATLKILYQNFVADELSLDEFVYKAIGLGIGLTPSGDDFIQGMMMAEAVFGQKDEIAVMTKEHLLERSTTDVSVAYYEALFDGVALHEIWLTFLRMVPDTNHDELLNQLIWMRRYGHTSGSDLLLGFKTYLEKFKGEILT